MCFDPIYLKQKICAACAYEGELSVRAYPTDHLIVDGKENDISIGFQSTTDFCRGVALAIQHVREGEKQFHEEQTRCIQTSGVMLDCSYEGMPTVEAIKQYVDYMAAMGLNMLMLYTEDTYEVKKYPQMGYQRGRYSQAELREIDAYAAKMGVELIGCIQTLGHMGQVMKWADFSDISENARMLLPGEERTYEFVEECIKTISENISSRRIHIGLDEVVGLCEGKYKKLHGSADPLEVFTAHVGRVYEICKKYGLKPMMWSDSFFTFSMENAGWEGLYSATEKIPQHILDVVPKDMEMVYWEYESQEQENYDAIIKAHAPLGGKCVMATAAWTLDGQIPDINYAFKTQVPALKAAIENGLETVLCTVWVCWGHAGDYFWTLPSLAIYGQYSYSGAGTDEESIARLLKNTTGMDLSALRLCDVYHDPRKLVFFRGEKYLNAPVLINTVGSTENPSEEFRIASERMRTYESERWGDLYRFAADLLEICSIKCELLNVLQPAYAAKNMVEMERCARVLVPRALSLLKSLREQRQARWLAVQKPFGFDDINANYGRAIAQMEYTKARLDSYVSGSISSMEELEMANAGYVYAEKIKMNYEKI